MFTVNKRDKLFSFTIESTNDGLNQTLVNMIINDNYTPYDIQE